MTKLPIRKRIGNVLQLSGSVEAAVAEEFTLERLYGIMKTYELEIEQDARMERGKKKGESIALVAELEKEKEVKMEAVESTSRVCENKGKGLAVESEDSLSQGDMEDIDEHLAFLSRRFAKLNECRKSDSSKKKFEPVDYKQKYFELLKQKEMDFITQENDWAVDGLDEDEDVSYVNLALMAKSDETETSSSSNHVITTNLAHLSKAECNDAINDMSTELYHLDIHAQITKGQGIESFCDATWKKNKEKLEPNLVDGVLTDVDSMDDEDHPSDNKKSYPSNDENPHPSALSKPINKAKLIKLNEKYGFVSKNL
ncbi:hypothetical protein AgCh_012382 [Apium graveolens]